MSDVIEIDASTGTVIERDFTPEELAQREADAEAARVADMHAEADRQVALQKRAALLERLGITEDEARLLLGGA